MKVRNRSRDYEKTYNRLVQSRKTRGLDKSQLDFVTEKHHIIPRCMGGGDEESNLVLLTGREHYIAHLLLTKFTTGQDYYKSLHALSAFLMDKGGTRSLNSRQIGKARDSLQQIVTDGKHHWQTEKHSNAVRDKHIRLSKAGLHPSQTEEFRKAQAIRGKVRFTELNKSDVNPAKSEKNRQALSVRSKIKKLVNIAD